MKRQRVTAFGIEVKKRLLDMNMTQAEFCEEYGIPRNRFSEILTGLYERPKYKKMISEILGIDYDVA